MKKLLIRVLLLPLNAVAQETPPKIYWAQKPVQCASMEEVIGLAEHLGVEQSEPMAIRCGEGCESTPIG